MAIFNRTKTVVTMTADIPDGEYGETITISFDNGYIVDSKEDEMHLINAVKTLALELFGEDVYVNLFDENGNEIWVR